MFVLYLLFEIWYVIYIAWIDFAGVVLLKGEVRWGGVNPMIKMQGLRP
jgi:hypothetical protein